MRYTNVFFINTKFLEDFYKNVLFPIYETVELFFFKTMHSVLCLDTAYIQENLN